VFVNLLLMLLLLLLLRFLAFLFDFVFSALALVSALLFSATDNNSTHAHTRRPQKQNTEGTHTHHKKKRGWAVKVVGNLFAIHTKKKKGKRPSADEIFKQKRNKRKLRNQ
jgi:Flp pilus assembly protein TadB